MTTQLVLPNFLIIGAARSGTTTLYSWLQEHPDIYLPLSRRPEPHFFLKSAEYAEGIQYYSGRYFSDWDGQKAIGEKSTSYLYQADIVAPRIKMHLPDVRLITLLRNPIDRAYSSYWFTVKSGLETLSFEEALSCEEERVAKPGSKFFEEIQPHAYIDRGHYLSQLKVYFEYFPREMIFIGLFDDLVSNPTKILKDVLHFLQVNNRFTPTSLHDITNVAAMDKPPMKSEIHNQLLEIYKVEIRELSAFIDRDLAHWESL